MNKRQVTTISILTALLFNLPLFAQDNAESKQSDSIILDKGKKENILNNADSPFEYKKALDISLFSIGITEWTACLLNEHFSETEKWNGKLLEKSNVNAFDRFFMHSYNNTISTISDITVYTTVALPLLTMATSDDYIKIAFMYAETMLLATGTARVLKNCVDRNRPYMYYEGGPSSDIEEGDYLNSWLSGHTTNAFAAAVFTAYTFSSYNPDSKWKIPVWIGSLSFATTTGVLRVLSGNHFATDVISGAILGSACGFLVPYLHKTKNTVITPLPAGIAITIKY
ncbi:MAG: phosphatase PAP2 family protein [Treponema sp.]|nr:phosphatase PAP2 family protein [Treponema sp.]